MVSGRLSTASVAERGPKTGATETTEPPIYTGVDDRGQAEVHDQVGVSPFIKTGMGLQADKELQQAIDSHKAYVAYMANREREFSSALVEEKPLPKKDRNTTRYPKSIHRPERRKAREIEKGPSWIKRAAGSIAIAQTTVKATGTAARSITTTAISAGKEVFTKTPEIPAAEEIIATPIHHEERVLIPRERNRVTRFLGRNAVRIVVGASVVGLTGSSLSGAQNIQAEARVEQSVAAAAVSVTHEAPENHDAEGMQIVAVQPNTPAHSQYIIAAPEPEVAPAPTEVSVSEPVHTQYSAPVSTRSSSPVTPEASVVTPAPAPAPMPNQSDAPAPAPSHQRAPILPQSPFRPDRGEAGQSSPDNEVHFVAGGATDPNSDYAKSEMVRLGLVKPDAIRVNYPAQMGPWVGGVPTDEAVAQGVQDLKNKVYATLKQNPNAAIKFNGFSEGSFLTNQAAAELEQEGIKVQVTNSGDGNSSVGILQSGVARALTPFIAGTQITPKRPIEWSVENVKAGDAWGTTAYDGLLTTAGKFANIPVDHQIVGGPGMVPTQEFLGSDNVIVRVFEGTINMPPDAIPIGISAGLPPGEIPASVDLNRAPIPLEGADRLRPQKDGPQPDMVQPPALGPDGAPVPGDQAQLAPPPPPPAPEQGPPPPPVPESERLPAPSNPFEAPCIAPDGSPYWTPEGVGC